MTMSDGERTVDVCGDVLFFAVTCLRMRVSLQNVAIIGYLYREGQAEPSSIIEEAAVSKSRLYSRLRYLEEKGLVRCEYRKDYYRQRVQLWSLTDEGKRLAREYERTYRQVMAHFHRRARIKGGGRL